MEFDSKCNLVPPVVLMGLLLCPWTWGISFWWDPTFSINGCSEVSCNFGVSSGEDEHVSLMMLSCYHVPDDAIMLSRSPYHASLIAQLVKNLPAMRETLV